MLQIRRAYRRLALRWHPDKNRDGPEQARSRGRHDKIEIAGSGASVGWLSRGFLSRATEHRHLRLRLLERASSCGRVSRRSRVSIGNLQCSLHQPTAHCAATAIALTPTYNAEQAEAMFKQVAEAYDVLSDPTKRSWYDL
eukprot:scaffold76046_cov73-Phaeocystis_antarctica.AAC.5